MLLSLREQADPQELIPRLPELIDALKSAVSTDIPINQLAPLLGLASQVDTKNIRSYVFAPPFYCQRHLHRSARLHHPAEDRRIRAAVKAAFTADPADEARARHLAEEGAGLWVLNGTGDAARGAAVAGYLDYHGIAASAPRQKPSGRGPGEHDDRRLQRRRGPAAAARSPTSSRRSG